MSVLAKVCARSTCFNRLGSLSLPRKGMVGLTDRPDMTLDVNRGRKTTQQQQPLFQKIMFNNLNELLLLLCMTYIFENWVYS